ncbi:helicase-exonuclease AddAB subunit AddA [Anaerostipes sp.]|uniref:helicase-exonuclease AddAB subunit AddA n=1 Tax=Anaerostipes sp. TaxID=1872530 RepID=UPI0025BC75FB|nr:helicase-exonuclease AddAB subunit AddA [Anaerostipes sp.]MBS7008538.1 helicase-exonuclease AddAB subunit AddA [Anaerostipes sp.]
MPWTKEQQQVIEERGCSLLVSAAAGSGKTAVLVERIIEKISAKNDPVDVDRLLVVTYTHAAANEMKERIRKAIEKKVEEEPENEHLIRQLSLIHKAQITTIHSFCLNLIRDYYYKLDLDPNFAIGDQGQMELMKLEVMDDVLEEAYGEQSDAFVEFIESYIPGKNDDRLKDYVLGLYESSRSHIDPLGWLSEAREGFQIRTKEELAQAVWMKEILKDAKAVAESACGVIKAAKEAASAPQGPYFYLPTLSADLEAMEQFQEAETYEDFGKVFLDFSKPRLNGRKKKTDVIDSDLQEYCKDLRKKAYGLIDSVRSSYFYKPESEIIRQIRMVRRPMEGFISLTERFYHRFMERKKLDNLLDFSDLEHLALELLTDGFDENGIPSVSEIAREKAEYYHEIYIDEYQDSNFLQDAILTSVSMRSLGGNNVFMVGDVKQSIYSFRLARPELFIEKYHGYQADGKDAKLIELRNNFRSRGEVLYTVNDIFYQIMHASLGNIEYTKDVALVPSFPYKEAEGAGGNAELLLVSRDWADASEDDKDVLEARMIADRIKKLVDGPSPQMVLDQDENGSEMYRKAEYRDIVILLRSVKGNAEKIQEVLMDAGIPAVSSSQSGYFDTVEVRVVLSLLTVVDNLYADIEMAAFLRSPMVGMTGEDLARLKLGGNKKHLYDCLTEIQEENEKACKALSVLGRLREAKTYLSLHELLWMAFDLTGYYHYAGAMPQGAKRQGNLLMLVEQAKSYEASRYKGVFHFIRYMEQCKEYNMDFGEANPLGGNENLVTITSIHKSKGLEYPIVFLSKTHKKFNLRDTSGSILFHPDYYIGPDLVNIKQRTKQPTIMKGMISRQLVKDSLGEELRVLYVALTRAKEKLIMTGVQGNNHQIRKGNTISYVDLLSARSYLEWLLMAAGNMDSSPFEVRFFSEEDMALNRVEEIFTSCRDKGMLTDELEAMSGTEEAQAMKRAFAYQYPYKRERDGRLKYSVSEIKRMSQAAEPEEAYQPETKTEPVYPKFLKQEAGVSPASRGTAVHKVMELLDFSSEYTPELLKKHVRQWAAEGKIEEGMEPLIPQDDIMAFLNSDLGHRIRKAAEREEEYKEAQFVMGVKFREMEPEAKSNDYVVVQGIIDLYFKEGDELVLVDYKTDRVKPGEEEILVSRYRAQLQYYKKALEQMEQKKVKECYIYSVPLRKAISL